MGTETPEGFTVENLGTRIIERNGGMYSQSILRAIPKALKQKLVTRRTMGSIVETLDRQRRKKMTELQGIPGVKFAPGAVLLPVPPGASPEERRLRAEVLFLFNLSAMVAHWE